MSKKNKKLIDIFLTFFIIAVLTTACATLVMLKKTEPESMNVSRLKIPKVNEFINTLNKAESVRESDDYKELIITAGDKTEVAYRVDEKTEIYATPDLSPDGSKIVTVIQPADEQTGDESNYGITIFDLRKKEKKIVVHGIGFGMDVLWSPNGNYVAYENEAFESLGDIYLFNTSTLQKEMLIDSNDYLLLLSWSINGRELSYWVSYGHGEGEYFAIDINTKKIRRIEESELDDKTKWQKR